MESLPYLWRDGNIFIWYTRCDGSLIDTEDFQLILNSPTILQCRELHMYNADFSFKDYKMLYSVNIIYFANDNKKIDSNSLLQFLEQSGDKPLIVLIRLVRESVDDVLNRLSKVI
ncbi:hypothetical protein DdX_21932 [Ditylenchus destructor]|uniref:Uncharacterized protein n=1 Tax=Ditylenchus destructor TaxID=166010 RepID=A0AAD4QV42_9BILA|nr:hypothetical protein DdX_21932 [Ditylenchus destructor]